MQSCIPDNNLKGIRETFFNDDPDLRGNTIMDDTLSSLIVGISPLRISYPHLPLLVSYYEGELINITWSGDADEYYAKLSQADQTILIQDWSVETSITLGYLPVGTYTLSVIGRNILGEAESITTIEVEPTPNNRPETQLSTLPNETTNSVVELHWDVTAGKNNIDHFEIQFRRENENWQILNDNIDPGQRRTINILETGYVYDFRMRAIALDGLDENYPAMPEARIKINSTCMQDLFEPNSAVPLENSESRLYTFCPENDVDTVIIKAETDDAYNIRMDPLLNQLPITVTIYDPNGEILETLSVFEKRAMLNITPHGFTIRPLETRVQAF
jgi:hypothetical protein